MRMIEDDRCHPDGSPVVLHAEGTCTGCRCSVSSTLYDMQKEGNLQLAAGYTIVTGEAAPPQGVPPDHLVAVGNCCSRRLKRSAIWVRGCPPNNVSIKQALVGDGLKVQSTYGSDTADARYEGAD